MANEFTLNDFESEALPHLNDLFRTVLRLVRRRAEAEDLVQETYLQAWKSFDRYQRGTNCRAWLYKILFFKLGHYRRRLQTQGRIFVDAEVETGAGVSAPGIDGRLQDDTALVAVEALPLKFREVVVLADVRGFSYKEIATILNIPIGTVMSRLNRGRKHLRGELRHLALSYGIGIGASATQKSARHTASASKPSSSPRHSYVTRKSEACPRTT